MGKSPKIIFDPGDVYCVDEMERMHLPHWPMEMGVAPKLKLLPLAENHKVKVLQKKAR